MKKVSWIYDMNKLGLFWAKNTTHILGLYFLGWASGLAFIGRHSAWCRNW